METLLAAKAEVPANQLRQLMEERAKAVQAYLLGSGMVTADRLFMMSPKTPEGEFKGDTRVHLALNLEAEIAPALGVP